MSKLVGIHSSLPAFLFVIIFSLLAFTPVSPIHGYGTPGGNSSYEWIQRVQIENGQIDNTSEADGGYGNHMGQSVMINAGETLNVSVTAEAIQSMPAYGLTGIKTTLLILRNGFIWAHVGLHLAGEPTQFQRKFLPKKIIPPVKQEYES